MKIIKMIGIHFKNSTPFLLLMLIMVLVFSAVVNYVNTVDEKINRASFAYSRQVISYGLTFAKSDDEVMQTIQTWKDDRWGAQIAALRTLCDNDFQFVEGLGGDGTGQRICRLIR